MKTCSLCGKEVAIDKFFSRKSACEHCKGDLHICLNCRFYSKTSHNRCIETKAEFQRSRNKANFCDYFQFREGPAIQARGTASQSGQAEEAKRKFDGLFKKK